MNVQQQGKKLWEGSESPPPCTERFRVFMDGIETLLSKNLPNHIFNPQKFFLVMLLPAAVVVYVGHYWEIGRHLHQGWLYNAMQCVQREMSGCWFRSNYINTTCSSYFSQNGTRWSRMRWAGKNVFAFNRKYMPCFPLNLKIACAIFLSLSLKCWRISWRRFK